MRTSKDSFSHADPPRLPIRHLQQGDDDLLDDSEESKFLATGGLGQSVDQENEFFNPEESGAEQVVSIPKHSMKSLEVYSILSMVAKPLYGRCYVFPCSERFQLSRGQNVIASGLA